jgi:hypothetical protein
VTDPPIPIAVGRGEELLSEGCGWKPRIDAEETTCKEFSGVTLSDTETEHLDILHSDRDDLHAELRAAREVLKETLERLREWPDLYRFNLTAVHIEAFLARSEGGK